jgi:hypothetical protein
VLERTVAFGETLEIGPFSPDEVYVLQLDIRYTALGRALTALAKAPVVRMLVARGDDEPFARRIVPGMMRSGVLVHPAPLEQEGWLRWLSGERVPGVGRLTVELEQGSAACFEPEIGVRVLRLDGLELPPAGSVGATLYTMFSTAPDAVQTATPPQAKTIRGRRLLIVGAPAELRFDLAPGACTLHAGFGMAPKAYFEEPPSDGAAFQVVLRRGGVEQLLFERFLDPVAAVPDRLPRGEGTNDLAFWTGIWIER